MVKEGNLLSAAKRIGLYMIITLGVYITGVVAYIVGGFVEEDVLPALGLNTTGSAYTGATGLISTFYTAINTIAGIVTVVTGLLTLNVVLQAFGIKLNLNMGGSKV